MSLVSVRKYQVCVETIYRDRGPSQAQPVEVATALAVVTNPHAGRFEPDVMPYMAELRGLGAELSARLIAAIGGAERIEAYGKAAIVGEDGDLEHGALWHEAGGWAFREALGGPKAIVPASKTVATMGARLMVPLGHIHGAFVRSHLSTTSIAVWDGPRRDEIVFGLAAATGPRIEARCGGLKASELTVHDGQR